MNSMAVPSQPDTAALVRSRVVRVATPAGAGVAASVIVRSFAHGFAPGKGVSPVVDGAVQPARHGQVSGLVGEPRRGAVVVLDAEAGSVGRVQHPVGEPDVAA